MTLKELIQAIEVTAAAQPSVRQIVREDIFKMNALADRQYGVFAWMQNQHSATVANGFVQYAFTLFYVDRLTANGQNAVDVQSEGMAVIDNVIRTLDDSGIAVDSYTVQPFTQRFLDECAGVFATVTFELPVASLCPEIYDEVGNYLMTSDGLYVLTSDGKKIEIIV